MSGVVIKLDDDDEEEDDDVAELLAGDDSLDSDEDSTRYLTTRIMVLKGIWNFPSTDLPLESRCFGHFGDEDFFVT